MRAILYPAAVALLSIMLIQSRCNVREPIRSGDSPIIASKGWENIATNCVMKYEEFVTAMEKRGRQ